MAESHDARFMSDYDRLRSLTCIKWTHFDANVIPAWVADMDLPPVPAAVEAVRALVDRGDFGYNFEAQSRLPRAFIEWQVARHGWRPDATHVRVFTDVMQIVDTALWLHTEPGDGVIVFTPVYPPFLTSVDNIGRQLLDCPLDSNGWRLDATLLREVAAQGAKAILLCNPHNPTGHVFTRSELEEIARVAEEFDLSVISDEIWADLVHGEERHIPFASLSDAAASRSVSAFAASKAFSLAGLRCAVAYISDPRIAEKVAELPGHLLGGVSSLGAEATLAAWKRGAPWLDDTRQFLTVQRDHALKRIIAEMPEIGVTTPEATYLLWLDFTALEVGEDPAAWFLEHAKVALSSGLDFGVHGRGFARLNYATSRDLLDEIINRLADAVRRR